MGPSSPSHRYLPRSEPDAVPIKASLGNRVERTSAPELASDEPGSGVELQPATSIDDYVAAPIGRCVVGPTYLMWCASPDLQGAIVWGVLDERSVREMMSIGQIIHHPALARRRRVLVDCAEVIRVDGDVLLGFTGSARGHVPLWAAGLERQAFIIPSGLSGILISGTLPSLGVSHPMRFVHDLEGALAFVDHPLARSAYAEAARISSTTRGQAVLLSRLRAQLGQDLGHATVETSAHGLGMSARTLQRELARLNTSFTSELRSLRIAAAEGLLAHSDLKIDAIANRLGFGTASRMSATLRRELNVTASGLRMRLRGA